MDDLVQFLCVRLAEDKQGALAATDGPWYVLGGGDSEYAVHTEPGGLPTAADIASTAYYGGGVYERADAEHIARHNPARVLAEVGAKGAVIGLYELAIEHHQCVAARAYRDVLRLFSVAYADHPDFTKDWAPDPANPS